jgi:pimeloyl-ACP methyl ester carboxylesterase
MDPENLKEFEWALAGEDVFTPELEKLQTQFEERVAVDPSTILDDFDLSESDREQLARPEAMQVISETAVEQAAHGVGGWVDDGLAFTEPWGFEVSAISVPVLVRYGLTDVLVPPAHGEWLAANVPGASSRSRAPAAIWERIPSCRSRATFAGSQREFLPRQRTRRRRRLSGQHSSMR